MQATIENILSQTATKTNKIQQLILLGLTRKEIANLVTNGNYGFVQNVYAKMRAEGLLSLSTQAISTSNFNRKFGVEFEAYNVPMRKLCDAINVFCVFVQ